MRKNTNKIIIMLIISTLLLGCLAPVMAEEATDSEVTEAETVVESKSIDDMTIDELKIAYLELQLENERLKNELNALQQDTPETEAYTGSVIETEVIIEAQTEGETVLMSVEEFENDIVASYNARSIISDRYTTAERSVMTNEEEINLLYEAVNAESDFYNKYKNATFDDLNILYLCNKYIAGLDKQLNACQGFFDTGNTDTFDEYWQSGYYDRAYVIVELSDYYDLPFGDISEMRTDTESMDSLNDAETRNAAVDSATVQRVQQLLNDIGFYCGNADGVSGKRTVKSIKRFQEMYGYDPIDGMIDDELVAQLEAEAAKKTPATEAEEAVTEQNEEN